MLKPRFQKLIVTLGSPDPETTASLLSQILPFVGGPTSLHSDTTTFPTVSLTQNMAIRCVPCPHPRILAVQRGKSSRVPFRVETTSANSSAGIRDRVQAWSTYLRHGGRIPLKYCALNLPVQLSIDDVDNSCSEVADEEGHNSIIPFLDGQLKEVAIPDPERVLLDSLENERSITRVATGVYQIPLANACSLPCYIRPLPTALHDHELPLPTLIFHREDSIEDLDEKLWAKIGHTGAASGQRISTVLQKENLLDVRLCSSTQQPPRSMFTEAQTSLLAGSLSTLQSNRVVEATTKHIDSRTNQADCWIEFRAQASQTIRKGW